MLPVSGAEQLHASGAMWLRPMISASGAYSTLLRPGTPTLGRLGQEQVPQSLLARQLLELLHHRRMRVRVAGRHQLLVVHRLGRVDVLVHEREQTLAQLLAAI